MFITALFTMPKCQNNPKGSMKNKLMNGRQKCGISIQGNVILHRNPNICIKHKTDMTNNQ